MFLDAIKMQILNGILALTSYILVCLVGLALGYVLSIIPFIALGVATYTNISLIGIIPVLMIVIKIIKD